MIIDWNLSLLNTFSLCSCRTNMTRGPVGGSLILLPSIHCKLNKPVACSISPGPLNSRLTKPQTLLWISLLASHSPCLWPTKPQNSLKPSSQHCHKGRSIPEQTKTWLCNLRSWFGPLPRRRGLTDDEKKIRITRQVRITLLYSRDLWHFIHIL